VDNKSNEEDDIYSMMMGDDPSAYEAAIALPLTADDSISSASSLSSSSHHRDVFDVLDDDDDDDDEEKEPTTTTTTSNRRHKTNRNRNRSSINSQNDGAILLEDNSRATLNRSGKIFNKLRKNDVVKVVDTPSGRAGFVYQSASNSAINTKTNNNNAYFSSSSATKSANSSNNNFPHYVNRNANDVKLASHDSNHDETNKKKILPVLTSDGKIALVVRGDTSRNFNENPSNNGTGSSIGSRKYEPIRNLTSIITALNNNNDNNNVNNRQNDSINLDETTDTLRSIQEQNRGINRLDDFFASVTNRVKNLEEVVERDLGINVERDEVSSSDVDENSNGDEEIQFNPQFSSSTTSTSTTTTTEPTLFEEESSRKNLLQINRPLSEVLGLPKKTYYNHPIESFSDSTKQPSSSSSSTTRHHMTIDNVVRRTNNNNSTSINTPTKLTTEGSVEEFDHESPEVINIAVIPGFDSEMEKKLFGFDRKNNQNDQTSDASEASQHCSTKTLRIMIAVVCAFVAFH
jgi:hypothetical protein